MRTTDSNQMASDIVNGNKVAFQEGASHMDQSFTISGQQITETYSGIITIHSRGKFTHRDVNKRCKTKEALLSQLTAATSLRTNRCPPSCSSGPCFQCSKITHCHPGSFLEGMIMKFSNSISHILWVFSYMLSTMVSINETLQNNWSEFGS